MKDDGDIAIDDDENDAVAEGCRRKDDVVMAATLRKRQADIEP